MDPPATNSYPAVQLHSTMLRKTTPKQRKPTHDTGIAPCPASGNSCHSFDSISLKEHDWPSVDDESMISYWKARMTRVARMGMGRAYELKKKRKRLLKPFTLPFLMFLVPTLIIAYGSVVKNFAFQPSRTTELLITKSGEGEFTGIPPAYSVNQKIVASESGGVTSSAFSVDQNLPATADLANDSSAAGEGMPDPTVDSFEQQNENLLIEDTQQHIDDPVLPNLLLVGAQKAGTTAIADWLFANDVCRPKAFEDEPVYYDKEVQFFDQKHRFEEGLDFYARRFEHCRGQELAMDSTPNTLVVPHNVEAIYRIAGREHRRNLKVIVVLREPVSRELSLYNHKVSEYLQTKDKHQWYSDVARDDGPVMPFAEYVDVILNDIRPDDWGTASMGLYSEHLGKWLKFVSRKNLLVISYDEFLQHPKRMERRIGDFLGQTMMGRTKVVNALDNKAKLEFPSCDAQEKLNKVFEPTNAALYKLLKKNSGPSAEQKPFPEFALSKCTRDGESEDQDKKNSKSVKGSSSLRGNNREKEDAKVEGQEKVKANEKEDQEKNKEPRDTVSEEKEGGVPDQHASQNITTAEEKTEEAKGEEQGDLPDEQNSQNVTAPEESDKKLEDTALEGQAKIEANVTTFEGQITGDTEVEQAPLNQQNETTLGIENATMEHPEDTDSEGQQQIEGENPNEEPYVNDTSAFLLSDSHRLQVNKNISTVENKDLVVPNSSSMISPLEVQEVQIDSLQRDTPISGNVLPNILLIGAPKAGSHSVGSWLFENGVCPPELFDGEPDYYDHEVQFFDQQSRYEQGLDFYAKRFQHCSTSSFAMDATPNTISFPGHVENIYKQAGGDHLKKLKVIVLLREPVSRELSFYNHKAAEYLQTKDRNQWYSDVSQEDGSLLPFQQHVDNVLRDIKDPGDWGLEWGLAEVGNYARHLRAWLNFVDRKNLLAISYDEFKADNKAVEDRVRNFLGFNFQGSVPVTSAHDGKAEEKPTCVAQAKLNVLFEPLNQDLYKILNENPGHSAEQRPFPSFPQLECTGTIPSDAGDQALVVADPEARSTNVPLLNTDAVEPGSVVLPNILLIGALKAGISSIAQWLFENGVCQPEVFDGEPEFYDHEVQFFDQQGRYEQGLDFYAKRFQRCNSSAFAMDATPTTLSFPGHVLRIYNEASGDHLKNLKVIVVLREPVSRELSLYNNKAAEYLATHSRTQWFSDISQEDGSIMPFNEHADAVLSGIEDPGDWGLGDVGHYAKHLSRWLTFLDRSNLLTISYDEFKEDSKKVEERIRQFLGFDFKGSIPYTTATDGKQEEKPVCFAQKKLNEVFEPMNQVLYRLLSDNPGPSAEQTPFPIFQQLECVEDDKRGDDEPEPVVEAQNKIELGSMIFPNVLLVGAKRAGVGALRSWLYDNGACVPEDLDGEPVQFFDRQGRYEQGLGFYAKHFQHCNSSAFALDATPDTLSFPEHVESIYKQAGEDHLDRLKVIVVLREPISRELSLYNEKVYEYLQNPSKDQWYSDISNDDGSILPFVDHVDNVIQDIQNPEDADLEWGLADTGHYFKHLSKWLTFVRREQLLVISYDEFKYFPKTVENRIRDFLGFNFPGSTAPFNVHSNKEKVENPTCQAQMKLNEIFEPMNQNLYKLLTDNTGPPSEQTPFPAFQKLNCQV